MAKQRRNQQLYTRVNIVFFIMDIGNIQWKLLVQYYVSNLCGLFPEKKNSLTFNQESPGLLHASRNCQVTLFK